MREKEDATLGFDDKASQYFEDKVFALVDPSKSNLKAITLSIQGALQSYKDRQWKLWSRDSEEVIALKRLCHSWEDSATSNPVDLYELYALLRSFSPLDNRSTKTVIETVKKAFYLFPLLVQQLDVENKITPQQLHSLFTRLDNTAIDALLFLLPQMTLDSDDKMVLVLAMIKNNAYITEDYAAAILAVANALGSSFDNAFIVPCLLSLAKTNAINKDYLRTLKEMLYFLDTLHILTPENVLACMDTLAQSDHELPAFLNPPGLWFLPTEYYQRLKIAMANFIDFIRRNQGKIDPQICFSAIFKHPTPYLYTDIIVSLSTRKMDTPENVQKLWEVDNAGALYILEIFSQDLTQAEFDWFIACKDIFSDKNVVAAFLSIHPGTFVCHIGDIIKICQDRLEHQMQKGILEFIANYNKDYQAGAVYRSCKESNFKPSGPLLYQPLSDHMVLGVGAQTSQDELKEAYIKMARLFHPELNPQDPLANTKFEKILAAYRRLSAAIKNVGQEKIECF